MSGLFVQVQIETAFKNDFWSTFGPTDSEGSVAFSRDDLLRRGDQDRTLFLMDYGHPEIDYTGHMEVHPMGREALRRAIDAYHQFQQVVSFPPRYAEQLQEARLALDEIAPARLEVGLNVSGGSGTVVGVAAEA
jgi:hypothetical protein